MRVRGMRILYMPQSKDMFSKHLSAADLNIDLFFFTFDLKIYSDA